MIGLTIRNLRRIEKIQCIKLKSYFQKLWKRIKREAMAQKVKHVCFEVWNVSYYILEGLVCLVPFSVRILKNCLVIVCHHQHPYFVCDSKILLQKRHENVCSVYRLRIAYASRTDGFVFALPKGIEFVPDKRKRDSAHLRFEHHDEGRWSNCLNSSFRVCFVT